MSSGEQRGVCAQCISASHPAGSEAVEPLIYSGSLSVASWHVIVLLCKSRRAQTRHTRSIMCVPQSFLPHEPSPSAPQSRICAALPQSNVNSHTHRPRRHQRSGWTASAVNKRMRETSGSVYTALWHCSGIMETKRDESGMTTKLWRDNDTSTQLLLFDVFLCKLN